MSKPGGKPTRGDTIFLVSISIVTLITLIVWLVT